jgi:hypothetical protein
MDRELQTLFARDITGLPALRQQGDRDFAEGVTALAAFTRDTGRAPDAAKVHDKAEAQLGTWLAGQRAADRRGRLSAQRAAALQGVLGRGWSAVR